MALSKTALANLIDSKLASAFPAPADTRDSEPGDREKAAEAIADAVVSHLTSAAVVTGACPSGGGPLASGRIT